MPLFLVNCSVIGHKLDNDQKKKNIKPLVGIRAARVPNEADNEAEFQSKFINNIWSILLFCF